MCLLLHALTTPISIFHTIISISPMCAGMRGGVCPCVQVWECVCAHVFRYASMCAHAIHTTNAHAPSPVLR